MTDAATGADGTGTVDDKGAPATGATSDTGATTDTDAAGGDDAAELAKWKAQARKHEERAKANATAARELEALRASTMSEQEKAVAKARDEGKAEALKTVGAKLAAAELKAAAAGRLDADQLAAAVEHLNLESFLDTDGDVDAKKVAAFIDGIAPKPGDDDPTRRQRDLGQGPRGGTTKTADPLLQTVERIAGLRR